MAIFPESVCRLDNPNEDFEFQSLNLRRTKMSSEDALIFVEIEHIGNWTTDDQNVGSNKPKSGLLH